MNPDLELTQPYPFQRLADLLSSASSSDQNEIRLTIGEPQHAPAQVALDAFAHNTAAGLAKYPATLAGQEFRDACAAWLDRRFGITVDSRREVLSVNGTREALFAIAQVIIDRRERDATVVMPNPFYQIYEGAALLAGAKPYYWNLNCDGSGLAAIESVSDATWRGCQLLYLCSPGNPSGAIVGLAYYHRLIELAHRHNFVIVADECYAEIYRESPPPSLLNACKSYGNDDFSRCLVFHSLSKRSNLPGLRSGFVSGDAKLLSDFLRYRTYHGGAMSPLIQSVSAATWSDDEHVVANRALYNRKYSKVSEILGPAWQLNVPAGGFYLWHDVGRNDEEFVRELFEAEHVVVLPGSYLAREDHSGKNPGQNHVRISLVASEMDCSEAARRIVRFIN